VAAKTDAIRKLVEERLAEIDKERQELQEALNALTGKVTGGRVGGHGKRSRRGKSRSGSSGSKSRPGKRRRKGGTRAEHAMKAVAANPGIKASEIAEQLKIKPNYVYRVMGELVKEGQVTKKGTGYFPA
jgi:Winged helix-turn-helix DNA-binding